MGFLLGLTLIIQITRGLVISITFIPETRIAFTSIVKIIQDTNIG